MKRRVVSGLFVILILAVGNLWGVELLYNNYGPRPLALGGAYIAVGGDPESVFWNPGGIPTVKSAILASGYQSYVGDMSFVEVYGAIGIPTKVLKFGGTVGLGFVYWNTSEEGWSDVNEKLAEDITAKEYIIALGYKKDFAGILSVGATLKYAGSDIAGAKDSVFVMDIGGLSTIQGVGLGLMVKNIGFGSTTVPMGMSLGAYYTFLKSKDNNHTFAGCIELDSVMEQGFSLKFGTEYSWYGLSMYDGVIQARLGYDTSTSKELGFLSGFSTGVGVSYFGISINYTLRSLGLIGFNHDFTLSYNIDNAVLRGAINKDGAAPDVEIGIVGSTVIVMGEKDYEHIKIKYKIKDNVGINKVNLYVMDSSGKTVSHEKITGLRGLSEYVKEYEWNGKDDKGSPVLDDVYVVSIEAEDLNHNAGKKVKGGLVVSSDLYGVILGSDPERITTIGETIKLFLLRKVDRGMKQWRVTIKDKEGKIVKRFGRKAEGAEDLDKIDDKAPTVEDMLAKNTIKFEDAVWDGTDQKGNLVDNGEYSATMEVEYDNGVKRSSFPIKVFVEIGR